MSADDLNELRDEVAAVLAEHRTSPWRSTIGNGWTVKCSCGQDVPEAEVQAHKADALLPLLARRIEAAQCPLTEHDGTHGPLIRQAKAEALREAAVEWEALVQIEKPPVRGSVWLSNRAALVEPTGRDALEGAETRAYDSHDGLGGSPVGESLAEGVEALREPHSDSRGADEGTGAL